MAKNTPYCHVNPSQQCEEEGGSVWDVGVRGHQNEPTFFTLGSQGWPSPEGRLSVIAAPISHVTATSVPLLTTP